MISTQVANSSHHIHRHEVDDRFWPKAAAGTPSHDVRYWPKADIGRRVRPNLNVAASASPPASASSLLSAIVTAATLPTACCDRYPSW